MERGDRGEEKMETTRLDNIKLGHSPLTDSIFLYRHGKNVGLALEKREAEADVFCVLIEHMMFKAKNGAAKTVSVGDKKYQIIVRPLTEDKK